ncbi:MAG: thioredoxin [Bacteroidales bacterium]
MILEQADTSSIISYIIAGLVVGYILFAFIKTKKRMNKPPSDKLNILSDANFTEITKSGVSLVDFWAEWCAPCRVQGPIIDEVAEEIGDKAKICKLDIDHNQKTAKKFGIQSIPTILIFKDGKPVEKLVGIKSKRVLINALSAHI